MSNIIKTALIETSCALNKIDAWHNLLVCANEVDGILVLNTAKHDFPGGGLSGVIIIGESHIAMHTWPENEYALIEIATCSDLDTVIPDFIKSVNNHGFHVFNTVYSKTVGTVHND